MQLRKEEKYTYNDYCQWDDGNRYELIDGEVYLMAPAPGIGHQRISGGLSNQLYNYLRGKRCEVFTAPFDVRLNADTADDTVVQPDISVICDPNKIKNGKSCVGAPDMIMEILSPSTAKRDNFVKFKRYLAAGVREYWIVNPETKTVHVYVLKEDEYVSRVYGETDSVPVGVLEDCLINLADVFPQETEVPQEGGGHGPGSGK